MRTPTAIALTLALGLITAAPAPAGDAEAYALYEKGKKNWDEGGDPEVTLSHFDQALEADPGPVVENLVLLGKGILLQSQIGDLSGAEDIYDQMIRDISTSTLREQEQELERQIEEAEGAERERLQGELRNVYHQLSFKARAMVNKANLIYSERNEAREALQLYINANRTFRQATTSDTASQFCYRVGQDPGRSQRARAEFSGKAVDLAREALEYAPHEFEGETLEAKRNKYQLQLAIALHGDGEADAAAEAAGEVDWDALATDSLYQQAVWKVIQDEPEAARELLERFMEETRHTPKARNDLRKFIREEPVFRPYLTDEAWASLVEDEEERRRRPGRRRRPTTRSGD